MSGDVLRADEPAAAGMAQGVGQRLDDVVRQQLRATGIPGAAVVVARRGIVVHHGCYGVAQDHDETGPLRRARPIKRDTMFDIASLTKVVATTAVVMSLLDQGALGLDDPVERHLARPGRLAGRGIVVADLLEHRAGLPAWQPLYLWADERDAAIDCICEHEPWGIGVSRVYSDLGMMLLGAVAEHAADAPLDRLVHRFVSDPLGLATARYRPDSRQAQQCAATSTGNPTEWRMIATGDPFPVQGRPADFPRWRQHTLVGEVNDGNAAYAFGGVAGHAGMFSDAFDLAVFGQALLQSGRYGGSRLWEPRTVARFTAAARQSEQALGFWRERLYALGSGQRAADHSYGHRGFTGCELVICPQQELVLVLLSNRLHAHADPPPDDVPLWRAVVRTALAGLSPGAWARRGAPGREETRWR